MIKQAQKGTSTIARIIQKSMQTAKHLLPSLKALVFVLMIALSSGYNGFAQSRIPATSSNYLESGYSGSAIIADHDNTNVVFFEVPDSVTSPIYFAVNHIPNLTGTSDGVSRWTAPLTLPRVDYYLYGGIGCLSASDATKYDYVEQGGTPFTGTSLNNFADTNSGSTTQEWTFFPAVYASQGEHIGNKYYFKVIIKASATGGTGNFSHAYQLDVSYSNSGSPLGISGIRTFMYSWTMFFQAANTFSVYPFVPEGETGNIKYNNFLYGSTETAKAFNKSGADLGALTISNTEAWPGVSTPLTIGTETGGCWEYRDTNLGSESDGLFWFTNSVTGLPYRAYSSAFTLGTPDHVVINPSSATIQNTTGSQTYTIQIVDASGNPIETTKNVWVSVGSSSAKIDGGIAGAGKLITTNGYGLGTFILTDAVIETVNVGLVTNTTNGSSFLVETTLNGSSVATFVANPDPLLVSTSNLNIPLSSSANHSIFRIYANGGTKLTTTGVKIKIPASLMANFSGTAPNAVRTAGAGTVGVPTILGNVLTIPITVNLSTDAVITVGSVTPLSYTAVNTVSSGSLQLSYDGGTLYPVSDDKIVTVVDPNPTYVWTGATNTDWSELTNWTPNIDPNAANVNVVIPNVSNGRYPLLPGARAVNNITIETNASIDVAGNTLTVSGSLQNTGTIYRYGGSTITKSDSDSGLTYYRTPSGVIQSDLANDYYNLRIDGAGAWSSAGALLVSGYTEISVGIASDITFTNSLNDFSNVRASSVNNLAITDANSLILGAGTISGTCTLVTSGDITQSAAISVAGLATFTPGAGNSVVLNTYTNSFSTVQATNGLNASFKDTNGIIIGASTITGTMTINASGAVSDSGNISAAALAVTGIGGIVLDNANTVASFTVSNSSSGNIELTNTIATLIIPVGGITNTGGGNVIINNTGALTANGAISASTGSASISLISSGTLTISAAITSAGTGTGSMTLSSSGIVVGATLNAGADNVILYPSSVAVVIHVGTSLAGFGLDTTELAYINTSGTLTFGRLAQTGAINVDGVYSFVNATGPVVLVNKTGGIAISANLTVKGNLSLIANGDGTALVGAITSSAGAISSTLPGGNLVLNAATGIGIIGTTKPITLGTISGTVSATNTTGGDLFLSTGAIALGGTNPITQFSGGAIRVDSSSTIDIKGNVSAGATGSIELNATGALTRSAVGTLTANTLVLKSTSANIGASGFEITSAAAILRASATGNIYITESDAVQLGDGTSGVTSSAGLIAITAGGALTTGNTITTSATGTSISISTSSGDITLAHSVQAANNSLITLISSAGSITQSAGTIGAISSTSIVSLSAASAIGTSGTYIQTDCGTLRASAGATGIYVNDATGIILGDATSGLVTTSNGPISITTTNGAITTGRAITSDGAIELNSGTVNQIDLAHSITTTGDLVRFYNPVRLTGNSTITSANGNITFDSTINADADANNRTLSLSSGTGNITVTGIIGTAIAGTTHPLSFSATASGVGTVSVQSVFTKGSQSYACGATSSITLIGSEYRALTDTAGAENISFTGPVIITSNTTMQTPGASADNISFSDSVDDDLLGGSNHSLTLDTGSLGNVTFSGAIGANAALSDLNALTVTSAALTTFSAAANIEGNVSITSDDIVLGANITPSTLDTYSLLVKPVTLARNIRLGTTLAGTLNITSAELLLLDNGWTSLTIGSASGTGDIIIDAALSFDDPLILQSPLAGGSITIQNSLSATGNATITLKASSGAGDGINLGADVSTNSQVIDFQSNVVVTSAAVTVNTTVGPSTGANILFSGTVNDDATPSALVLNYGTAGSANISSAFGDLTPFTVLELRSDNLNLSAALNAVTIRLYSATVNRSMNFGSATGAYDVTDTEFKWLRYTGTALNTGLVIGESGLYTGTVTFQNVASALVAAVQNARITVNASTGAGTIVLNDASGAALSTGGTGNIILNSGTGGISANASNGTAEISTSGTIDLTTASTLLTTGIGSAANRIEIASASSVSVSCANAVAPSAVVALRPLGNQSFGIITTGNRSLYINNDGVGSDTRTFAGAVTVGTGNIILDSSGAVTQSSAITGTNLELLGTGSYTLTTTTNDIDLIAGSVSGLVSFVDTDDLTVGTFNSIGLSSTLGGSILLAAGTNVATHDLTITNQISTSGGAGTIQLFAGDSITQNANVNAGANAVTLNAGRNYQASLDVALGSITGSAGIIIGGVVTLNSATGIGVISGPRINTQAVTINAATHAAGNIAINESNAVDFLAVTAFNGSIELIAGGAASFTSVVSTADNAANDIALLTSAGNMTIGIVNAKTLGDVTLTSAGTIIDAGKITANNLIASTAGAAALDTTVTSLSASTSALGNITITETDGITLTSVSTFDGAVSASAAGAMVATLVTSGDNLNDQAYDITLTTTGANNLTLGAVTADNNIILSSGGAILDGNGVTLNLTGIGTSFSSSGNIGSIISFAAETGDPIEVSLTSIGNISTTTGTQVFIEEVSSGADLALNGTIDIAGTAEIIIRTVNGSLNASGLTFTSTGGDALGLYAINTGNTANLILPNLGLTTTGNLRLVGADDVSDSDRTIILSANDLYFRSGDSGSDLTITSNLASTDAALTGAGSITLIETNGITLTSLVTANGAISVNAAGLVTATYVESSTDLDVNDISISTTVGNISVATINAQGVNADVTLTANTQVGSSVIDDGAATVITCDVLTVTAKGNIGTTASPLDTSAKTASLTNTGSDSAYEIVVSETDNLNISSLVHALAAGACTITTNLGSLTVTGPVNTLGSGVLTLASIGAGNDIRVSANINAGTGNIVVNSADVIYLNTGTIVTNAGTIDFQDPVTLEANTLVDSVSGNITFVNTIDDEADNTNTLTVNTTGITAFQNVIGTTYRPISLETNAGGSTRLYGNVSVWNTIVFGDALILYSSPLIQSVNNQNITFSSTINGDAVNTRSLTVNTSGVTIFTDVIGVTRLNSLTTNSGGSTRIYANISVQNTVSLGDAVLLYGNITISSNNSGAVDFSSIVNDSALGTHTLTVNTAGATTFTGAVGGSTAIDSLTTDAPGTVNVNANISTSDGAITLNDPLTVTGSSTFNTNATATNHADIILAAVDAGANTLTLQTGNGVLNANVNVASFSATSSGGTLALANIGGTALFTGNVETENSTVANTVNNVTFTGTVNSATSAVTFSNTGTLTIGDANADSFAFTSTLTAPGSCVFRGVVAAGGTGLSLGSLSIPLGLLDIAGSNFTITTMSNDTVFRLTGAQTTHSITNLDTDSGIFEYYGNAAGTVFSTGLGASNNQYYNLRIAANATIVKTLDGAIEVLNDLYIQSGVLDVSASNHLITVRNNWRNDVGHAGFVSRAGTVDFIKASGVIEVRGNNTWYIFKCIIPGVEIRFENTSAIVTQRITTGGVFRVKGNAINSIVLTRITNNGVPSNPPNNPLDDDKFWFFDLLPSATFDLDYVTVYYSNARTNPVSVPGSTVNATPYTTYFCYKWLDYCFAIYSYTEDSDYNGKIDRIRVTTEANIQQTPGQFNDFAVYVEGYAVSGYSVPEAVGKTFYIHLVEKPYLDTDKTPKWKITQNTTFKEILGKIITTVKRAYDAGNPQLDVDLMIPGDTAWPVIGYALTIPNVNGTFVHFSEPVVQFDGITPIGLSDFGGASSFSAITTSGIGTKEALVNIGTYTSPVLAAGATNFTVTGTTVDLGSGPYWEPAYAGSQVIGYPEPTYPPLSGYTGSPKNDYVPYGSPTPSGAGGYFVSRGTFYPYLDRSASENIHRVTDVLINVPPASAIDDRYFMWPVFAKDSIALTNVDSLTLLYTQKDITKDQGLGLVRNFDGTKWLRDQNTFISVYTNPALTTTGLDLLYDTSTANPFITNLDSNKNYDSKDSHDYGFWLPIFDEIQFSGLVPFPNAPAFGGSVVSLNGTLSSANLYGFSIDAGNAKYADNKRMQFVFELKPDVAGDPLYGVRLAVEPGAAIPTNWYRLVRPFEYDIRDVTLQRGSVTILNNVINPDKSETVRLSYQIAKAGTVTITVFTLDGDVVTILVNERKEIGDYSNYWDGKNKSGKSVARGIYFIRVVGPNIDEMRKVMIVK